MCGDTGSSSYDGVIPARAGRNPALGCTKYRVQVASERMSLINFQGLIPMFPRVSNDTPEGRWWTIRWRPAGGSPYNSS
jgi:hypothetical protein